MNGPGRPVARILADTATTLMISLSLLVLVAACSHDAGTDTDAGTDADVDGDGDSDSDSDSDTDDTWGFDTLEVEWEPCSLYPEAGDGLAECAMVSMPLRWLDQEDGERFDTYAKRLLSGASESEGQLWLLHGGPGASGTVGLPSMMEQMQAYYPELDLYTIDARGTGWSQWLGCPEQEDPASELGSWVTLDELDGCVEYVEENYGEILDVYGPTHAAIDLAALIANTRQPGKKILIWGGSGGTFWAQRYLRFFPEQADGVVIEGIVPPNESLVFQDEYDDEIATRILEMCEQDEFCSSKLPDPVATLEGLYEKLDGGHCSYLGLDTYGVKSFIRSMDYYFPTNQFMPAFIYRMDRCDSGDITAIYSFYTLMWGGDEDEHSFSNLLFFNEGYSELWEHELFESNGELVDYLETVDEEGLITMGMGLERNEYYLKWPRYSDPYDDTWAESDVPMLMLQGQIDPSTPHDFAQLVGDHFDGQHQHWTSFPYATHNVASGSPVEEDIEAMHCGQRLFVDFLKDPTGDLETSCVGETLPLDFEGLQWAPVLLGTADYWENDAAEKGPTGGYATPELGRTMRALGRDLAAFRQL